MEAPRPVPPYDMAAVAPLWWYCLYCRHTSVSESAMGGHVHNVHEVFTPEKGVDYTNGNHLRVMTQRWEEFSLLAVDKFAAALDSLRGAEDLLVDIGDGVPGE